MLLGGITAEKLYIGDISTGASNDLKRATNIARRMVTEWGMSAELGMVYCGSEDEVFIGKTYQERMPYSEDQAAKIDNEVKKIIELCQKETEKILVKNKKVILTMAQVLMEKETIYAEEVDMILAGKGKDEVIAYIENKDKKPETPENQEQKPENQNQNVTTDLVDELLKVAEQREKKAAEATAKQEEDKKQDTTETEQKPLEERQEQTVEQTKIEETAKPSTKKRTTTKPKTETSKTKVETESKTAKGTKKTTGTKTIKPTEKTKKKGTAGTTENRKKITENTEKIDKKEEK